MFSQYDTRKHCTRFREDSPYPNQMSSQYIYTRYSDTTSPTSVISYPYLYGGINNCITTDHSIYSSENDYSLPHGITYPYSANTHVYHSPVPSRYRNNKSIITTPTSKCNFAYINEANIYETSETSSPCRVSESNTYKTSRNSSRRRSESSLKIQAKSKSISSRRKSEPLIQLSSPTPPTPQDLTKDPLRKSKTKTELCLHYSKFNLCPFGNNCNYAHGEDELKFTKLLDMEKAGLIVDAMWYRTHPCWFHIATGAW